MSITIEQILDNHYSWVGFINMQINNYFTILKKEFRGYNASAFMKDALAGITCTLSLTTKRHKKAM